MVDAVRCAIEVQNGLIERNAGLPPERRIEFRVGIHLGDVVEESDGDLMGDGVNIAARLESICEPGAICLSEDAYRQVKGRLELAAADLGPTQLKNIAEPIRVYSLQVGAPAQAKPAPAPAPEKSVPPRPAYRGATFRQYWRRRGAGALRRRGHREPDDRPLTDTRNHRDRTQYGVHVQRQAARREDDRARVERPLRPRGQRSARRNATRVNVQLIDAEDGSHLWAERFDNPLTDLLDMQDEIVARLARQLDVELIAAEARRAELSVHPTSIDLYFKGMASFNKGLTPEYLSQARAFFERALALDPCNVAAQVGGAAVDVMAANSCQSDDNDMRLASAEKSLRRTCSRFPDHAHAHFLLGVAFRP